MISENSDGYVTRKRNQHFVPRFYLKNFSVLGNEKQLVVFNVKKEKYIRAGSLSDQAVKKYYYGKDGEMEEGLSKLEGEMAQVIHQIKVSSALPAHASRDHRMILYFVVTTEVRNPKYAKKLQEITESFGELIKQHVNFPEKYRTPEYKLGLKDPAIFSFLNYRKHVIILSDLHAKLLINDTPLPFITSDNPIIHYNQFLEQNTQEKAITGFAIKGLQMFVPISPKLMLMLYDSQVYYVGNRKRKTVQIQKREEIDQLNTLQLLNSSANVYGSELLTEAYANKLLLRASSFEKPGKEFIEEFPGTQKDSIIRKSGATSCRTNLGLSFVFLSTHAGRYNFENTFRHGRPFAEDAIDAFQNDPRFQGLNDW